MQNRLSITWETLREHVQETEDKKQSLKTLRRTLEEIGLNLDNPTTLLSQINYAPLSSRTKNTLRSNGHVYIYSLLFCSQAELLRYIDFGTVALEETKQMLGNMGAYLNCMI